MSPQAGKILVEDIAPRLRVKSRSLPQIGADDAEEIYQDGLAIAARMLESAEQNGKEIGVSVTPANIAWYAGKQLATGRRSTYGGRTDALAPSTQLDGHVKTTSFQQEAVRDTDTGEGVESVSLFDLLATAGEDPARAAARNLDWATLLEGLDPLSRRMIQAFANGDSMRDLKADAGLSDSGMSGRKKKLIAQMLEILGPDCLEEAEREPAWRDEINAQREREACRQEIAGR